MGNLLLQALGIEALAAPSSSTKLRVPTRERAGKNPTLKQVIGLTAANRSVALISSIGSGIPLQSWRGVDLVERQPQVIRQPNPRISKRRWQRQALTSYAVDGNLFARLYPDPLDSGALPKPIAAPVMNPFLVKPRTDRSGRQVYDVVENAKATTLSAEEVLHSRLNDFPGFDRGISPVTACRLSLSGALDTHEYASTIFDIGSVAPGVLNTDQKITPGDAKDAQTQWHEDTTGRIKVLGQGLNYVPMLLKPEDAQWIEAQRFNVLEIARMWGIPAVLLAAAIEGSSLTYQNLQDVLQHLVSATLGPEYVDVLAADMSEIVPNGQEVRPDYAGVLRRGDKERMQTHKLAIDAGIYSNDEARAKEGIAGPAPKPAKTPKAAPEEPAA